MKEAIFGGVQFNLSVTMPRREYNFESAYRYINEIDDNIVTKAQTIFFLNNLNSRFFVGGGKCLIKVGNVFPAQTALGYVL